MTYSEYKKAKAKKNAKLISAYEKQENKKLAKLSKKYLLSIKVGDRVKTLKGRVGTKGFRGVVVGVSKFRQFDGVKVLKKDKRVILCLAHNLVKC